MEKWYDILTENDKILGLIILSLSVIALSFFMLVHIVFSFQWALDGGVMTVGWFVGATMVWAVERFILK